ncbi:MAG: hypothetical protein ACI9AH_001741, partial [Oceanospirillaceae bacterium]
SVAATLVMASCRLQSLDIKDDIGVYLKNVKAALCVNNKTAFG